MSRPRQTKPMPAVGKERPTPAKAGAADQNAMSKAGTSQTATGTQFALRSPQGSARARAPRTCHTFAKSAWEVIPPRPARSQIEVTAGELWSVRPAPPLHQWTIKARPVGCLELTLDGAILTEAVTAACRKRDMAPPTTQVVPTSKLLDEDDFVELYHRVESTTIAWVHIHLGETNRSDAPGPEVVGDRIAAVAEHQVREGRHFTILGTCSEAPGMGGKRVQASQESYRCSALCG